MHRISTAFLAFFLVVYPLSASSADSAITHYDIDAEIFPGQGILRAKAALRLAGTEGGLRQVRLLLNRGLAVRSVTSDGGIENYTFDRTAPSGHRYTPTAAPLIVNLSQPLTSGQSTVLRVSYEGTIEPDTWQTNFIKSDWVELALYVAWYPYDPAIRTSLVTSRVTVKIEPGYSVTGTGSVAASESGWVLTQDRPAWDIIVVASKDLRVQRISDEKAGTVEVCYARLGDDRVSSFSADAGRIMTGLRAWFGPVPDKNLRIVFVERKTGGGYYRPGFMTLIWEPDYRGLVRYAAHEAAHFWWGRGLTTSWEDWLNESFAEYSALMLMRDWYGDQVFTDYLERYQKEAQNKPAIWGLDRDHEAAFVVLYRKGPVLLNRLEQRMGKERFLEFLGTLVANRVTSTDQLLATIEQIASREMRQTFEQGLKE